MTGRHRLHIPIGPVPPMPNLFAKPDPAPSWPTGELLSDVELADTKLPHELTRVFGPVSLVEQERAEHSDRVAELEREIARPPRWLLVRLAVGTGLFVVAIVLTAVLTGCTTATAGIPGVAPTPSLLPVSPSVGAEPEEDEPGFDCHTMRNRVCGPTEVRA